MKTILVSLHHYNGQGLDSWIDHGAGMTYTAAKEAGCDIDFLDMKTLSNDDELKEKLKGYDLVAISLKSSYYSIGMKVTKFAKAQGSKVMIGGYHATAAPNELIENPDIDYIFKGESEITFPKFLKDCSNFKRTIVGEKPQNLDILPFIDRSIYREPIENCDNWWHVDNRQENKTTQALRRYLSRKTMTTVMAARGCPYNCAFCQPLERNHFGRKLRRRSVNSLITELKQLKDLYNPDCVMIHDDTFLLQPKWLEEFIERYPEINLPFWASGRADGICKYPDLVKKLVKVGWELISVGFESGSQRVLDKLKKGTTVEQNLEAARIIKSNGAKVYANYITGIPWETKWDVQASAKMADTIAAEMPSWAYFTPYPGCELGEECIRRGWSLLNRETYDRCPSGKKVKYVDYDYIGKVRQGMREETYPEFCDIIIPSYNNEEYTIACIESIKKHTKPGSYRIIWVDNASKSTAKVDEVIDKTDHITIKNTTNEGFVGAINKGLEVSDAPNVCLLNNDTVVSKNWLNKLITSLHKSKDIGIIGALTNYGKGSAVDSHHSLTLHSGLLPSDAPAWDLAKINLNLEKRHSGRSEPIIFVAFLCAIIKREVINKVGHLDPNYAMGMWDDLDYNRGVRKAGYKTEIALDTCIQHHGRATFNLVQTKEGFDVDALLKKNKAYLDKKWKKDQVNDTFIISRAVYDTLGNKQGLGILTNHRLEMMQRYFINSLKNQTDQGFTIYMVVGADDNEATAKIKSLNWGNLNVKFIYTDGNMTDWKSSVSVSKNYGQEKDIGCPEYIVRNCNHPLANIMARLDTDDWVAPGWIAHMRHMAATIPESHFLINYQVISQAPDGILCNFHAPHNRARTSPFIVLVQKEEPRISPYRDTHLNMGRLFAFVHNIPPSYVFMVVHGENRSNRIYLKDKYIGGVEECKIVSIKKEKNIRHSPDRKNYPGTDWRSRIANAEQDRLISKQSGGQG